MKSLIPGKKALFAGACAMMLGLSAVPASAADDVFALQNALYGAGYDISSVDGQMGPGTRSALKAFQKDQSGLKVTGELDENTKEALGMVKVSVAQSASVASASQSGTSASSSSSAQPEPKEPEEDVVEEDDDGGWLFF